MEFLNSNRPSVHEPSYMIWINTFNNIAGEGKINAMLFLKQIEDSQSTTKTSTRKLPDRKPYVTSVLHRIKVLLNAGVDVHKIPYPYQHEVVVK